MSRNLLILKVLVLIVVGLFRSAQIAHARQPAEAPGKIRTTVLEEPSNLHQRVYLIGDAGGADEPGAARALQAMRRMLDAASDRAAVVFLGDNIYCCGLPDSLSEDFDLAQRRIEAQLSAVDNFSGRVFFIPGNHDWGSSGSPSASRLNNQERYVESRLARGNSFIPDQGLPGPHEVELTDRVHIVAIDTQWWLLRDQPTGETDAYEILEEGDLLIQMQELLSKRDDEDLLILGHHPIHSTGPHGGRFPISEHLFPLTGLWNNAYVPIPGLGTAYLMLRSVFGGRQDLSHWKYRSMRRAFDGLFAEAEGRIIYASGHEHSLQHIRVPGYHQIISGSGSRPNYAADTRNAPFVHDDFGFLVLDYLETGRVILYGVGTSDPGDEPRILYKNELYPARPVELTDTEAKERGLGQAATAAPRLEDSETAAVAPELDAGRLHRFFLGGHHRTAWRTPVNVPVFDVGKVAGGLTPVKRGGGMQTTSVRLLDAEGNQFVLRSINKDPTRSLPIYLQETIARDIALDQISILNPFGALMEPPLARAAGLFYTAPRLYYVPDDPRFGPFRDLVAGQVMQFERRPDDDMRAFPQFGSSEDVESAAKVYRDLREDNDDRIDVEMYARARLFDMYISDWDRHRDQWRWASYDDPDGKGRLFKPIARDRDWAFNRMNGVFPTILKQPYVMPKFQDFRKEYGPIQGLTQNGLRQDRRFTASLNRHDWLEQAERLQSSMTEAAIDSALAQLPDEVLPLYEAEYKAIFRSRRDDLPRMADEMYEYLSRLVDVVGTDKHEMFDVVLHEDSVHVRVHKTLKEGDLRHVYFERTFYPNETEEIRLYGLGGTDRFHLSGSARNRIRIYAIGGPGNDEFIDLTNSDSAIFGQKVAFYDTIEGSSLTPGPVTSDERSRNSSVNIYDASAYWDEPLLPVLFLGSNQDDGLFIGGGISRTSYRFRRTPFSTRQKLRANIATKTAAFNILYDALFIQQLGNWAVGVKARARTPNNTRNYYGLGNETSNLVGNDDFYETRLARVGADVTFRRLFDESLQLYVGPTAEFVDVRRDRNTILTDPSSDVSSSIFNGQVLFGAVAGFEASFLDNPVMPLNGFRWKTEVHARVKGTDDTHSFTRLKTDLTVFTSPGPSRQSTVALRVGGEHNLGTFPFFYSSTLGGNNNLRGWRSTRFSGRTSFYQSLELRRELFSFTSILATGRFGVLGFVDNGRVWTDGKRSKAWHQGYGGGVFINLFDITLFRVSVGVSEEELTVSTGVGFAY